MIRNHLQPRTSRVLAVSAGVAAAALGVFALVSPGSAIAGGSNQAVPAPPAVPTSADQIQNIDQVKTAIKGYYKDTPTPATDPVTGLPTTLHFAATDGPYAAEMGGVAADAEKYLAKPKALGDNEAAAPGKAVLFDVDDTLLNTYSYEIYSNFVFNLASNGAFVNAEVFPAVPHMVDLEHYAESKGYTVFFLTGRPEAQRTATIGNLEGQGYDVASSNLFLKDLVNEPWLSSCATSVPVCTTTQYKSLTRKHIEEDLGYDIVANLGDQFSDLNGGFADETFKLPNPMYFLP